MTRKSLLAGILLIFCVAACFLGYQYNKYKVETKEGLEANCLSYILPDNNGESEYAYAFKLTNTSRKGIFVKDIEPLINQSIKNKVLSKDTKVTVNKNIKPNESIQINGIIIVDTKELFSEDIKKFITDIKVSTEEDVKLK